MHESYIKKWKRSEQKKYSKPKVCLVINFHKSETLLMVIWLHIGKTIELALFLILIKLPVLVV